jgi:predicted dehydrogenase
MPKQDPHSIGFAVVGYGVIGKHHCKAVTQAEGAELVAVCDTDSQAARSGGEEHGVPGYTSLHDLFTNSDVDVVNVCVPTGVHAEVGIAAARAGKHVVCEKPLDVNLEKADALIRTCRHHGVKLASIFQRRLHPLSRRVKEAVDSGRLGRIVYADIHLYWYRTPEYYAGGRPPNWRGTFAMDGGGACMNQGIHSIDFIQWIAGPVRSVVAKVGTFTHAIEAEDVGTATIQFVNGALGNITCATSAYPGLTNDFHLLGERGSIVLVDNRVVTWRIQQGDAEKERAEEAQMQAWYRGDRQSAAADPAALGGAGKDGHILHIEDMVQAIREGRDPVIPGEQARHAIEIAVAIQESARLGRELTLPL